MQTVQNMRQPCRETDFLHFPDRSGLEKIEDAPLNRSAANLANGCGIGVELRAVAFRTLGQRSFTHTVGLEVEDNVAVLRLDETVDDALQKHVLLRLALRRREIA